MGNGHTAAALLGAGAVAAAAGPDCFAGTEAECLTQSGCRWYAYRPERHCEICNSVFPDSREITGCRDWTPSYYCRRIYLQTLGKWGKDPTDSSFREAIRNYHVSQGSGEPGNWHSKHWRCSVWCDASAPYACEGQPRSVEDFRGVNYGGRFVPEKYLGLPGTDDLFHGVMQPKDVAGRHVGSVSLCDVGQQIANASQRVSNFLDVNIKPEHFSRIAAFGFNVVRLPLGYWNLVDLPGAAAPNGLTPERWRGLQGIMPASRYGEWIDRVFDYAGESGLRVLLDLHGAPGGQTGNAFTGCDTGKGHCNFDTAWNKQLAVQAVEKMAQLCRAHGRACYGIELLNEPAFGRSDLRPFLKDYYGEAMKAARRHLDKDVPLVIMDWTQMLPWWKEQKPFTYGEFGRVVFSTHMYDGFGVHGQHRSRQAFVEDLREIEDFFYGTKYEVIVSEYSLSGHGTGKPEEDSFDYHSLANWLVHQISQRSLGSAVWNYDAAGFSRIWGPVADENLGARPIRWKDIFELGLPGSAQELRASSVDARSSALRGEVRSAELRSAELEELRASSVDARSSALRGEARSAELRSAELEVLAAQQPAQGSTFQGLVALLPAPGFGLLALLAALAAGLVSLVAGRSLAREAPQASLQLRMNEEEGPAQGVETARGEQATLKNVRANGLYAAMPRETDCPDSVDGVIYNL